MNFSSERAVLSERTGDWDQLFLPRKAHVCATGANRTVALLRNGFSITGLIRTALAIRSGGHIRDLRKCLRAEVRETVREYEGDPPSEAQIFKKIALHVFTFKHDRVESRCQLFMPLLPNGEWRVTTEVQVWVPTECHGIEKSSYPWWSFPCEQVFLGCLPRIYKQDSVGRQRQERQPTRLVRKLSRATSSGDDSVDHQPRLQGSWRAALTRARGRAQRHGCVHHGSTSNGRWWGSLRCRVRDGRSRG